MVTAAQYASRSKAAGKDGSYYLKKNDVDC